MALRYCDITGEYVEPQYECHCPDKLDKEISQCTHYTNVATAEKSLMNPK